MMSLSENIKSKVVELLPLLADIAKNEDALHTILMGVYTSGVADGRAEMSDLLKSVTTDISVIVFCHIQKDAEGLKAALDDFVDRRCVVSGDASIKTRSLH